MSINPQINTTPPTDKCVMCRKEYYGMVCNSFILCQTMMQCTESTSKSESWTLEATTSKIQVSLLLA